VIDNPRSPRVRAVAKLAKRTAREETGYFLVEGPQAVAEAFACRPELAIDLFITRSALDRGGDFGAAAAGVDVELVTDAVLEAMADTVTPQGVVAVFAHLDQTVDSMLDRQPKLLAILDEIRDPGNAGTIIRAADATGADGVVLAGRHVDVFNPKVVRSTTGSIFHLPIAQNADLEATVAGVREAGIRIVAADIKGDPLPAVRELLPEPTAWLFGNEAHGLSDEALELADRVVRLPIYGRAESLNLATAASVCLYESAFAQRA
jgi:TrmH family RNA methyltransferase